MRDGGRESDDRPGAADGGAARAQTLLVAGTASHVGKSTVAAGLCRRLRDCGVSVAPFKAQNMSNNARAAVRSPAVRDAASTSATGTDASGTDAFGEIGVSQHVQARAAGVTPTTDHNPVLLKPRGGGESQVVLDGVPVGHAAAGDYYEERWDRARRTAERAHARLAAAHDVVVAEGAGSIAEINLHDRDLANVETARFADADVLLVADVERGGVFASIVGTLELLPDDLRDRVVGTVVTKFRGDRSILEPGLREVEARTGVPVLAVLPYDDPGLPAEDSVGLPTPGERSVRGGDDGVPDAASVTVAVPRLPRASNVTDLEPLAADPGVRVAYVPLDADLSDADAVVLSGTKNTVDDLLACREAGLVDRLRSFEGPVVGLCGGYQLLGRRLLNVGDESADERGELPGVGLLPVETTFTADKRVAPVTWRFDGVGPFAGVDGSVSGYEIHTGETRAVDAGDDVATPFARHDVNTGAAASDGAPDAPSDVALGAARGDVVGTYLHGLFENDAARDAFVGGLFDATGRVRPRRDADTESPFDRAAGLVARLDLASLGLVPSGEA
jgi:adenosylcobyric acid synthase